MLALDTDVASVYVAGDFYTIGGVQRSRLAAVDLTTGRPTDWDPGASSTVRALLVDGSTVYAGGLFTTIGGAARNRIAALGPNPARARSMLTFDLARAGDVTCDVFDVAGRRVAMLLDRRPLEPGRHEVLLPMAKLPVDVYIVRVSAGNESAARRIVRVR